MPIIVGSSSDPHVRAVAEAVRGSVLIVDAATLNALDFTIAEDGLRVSGSHVQGRAWLRRLAPPEWPDQMRARDHQAAVQAAALSALAAVLRDERLDWLSPLDAIAGAENKPRQYRLAATEGAPVPEWLITSNALALGDRHWVAKPLGPGHFFDNEGHPRVVPTTTLDPSNHVSVSGAPFLYQELVRARRHARIVTVCDSTFSATLNVTSDMPLDWRRQASAHHSFRDVAAPKQVCTWASRIAKACGVRFSAQDWIMDQSGQWFFVDLNPSGQWLFLPDDVATGVTNEIAAWIEELR